MLLILPTFPRMIIAMAHISKTNQPHQISDVANFRRSSDSEAFWRFGKLDDSDEYLKIGMIRTTADK